jgi:hypothetical protein
MSTDAIVLLEADHQEIREQFRRFAAAGENAAAAKGGIVEKIIELLTVHTFIENEVMYPEVRKLLPDLEDEVLEVREGLGRKQLQDLGARIVEMKRTAPTSPAWPSALKKAIDAVIASSPLGPPR